MMASTKLFAMIAFVAIVVPTTTMATDFWVGGSSGWNNHYDYQAWAKDKTFQVGDRLVFNYTRGEHNVFKVNATAFANCTVPPQNQVLDSGHDVIPLATTGKKWYICGFPSHCSDQNQKLTITVQAAAPTPAPSPVTSGSLLTSGQHVLITAIFAVIAITAPFF